MYRLNYKDNVSSIDSSVEAQTVAFTIKAEGDGSAVNASGSMAALGITTSGVFPAEAAMTTPSNALKNGFATKTEITYGAGSFMVETAGKDSDVKILATNESARMTVGIAPEALTYGIGMTGATLTVNSNAAIFPELTLSYGEAAFDLTMPLLAKAEPSDFSFLTRIVDLRLPEELWAMLDPTKTLPHDPATLIVETKGTATLRQDLLDGNAMQDAVDTPPGELNSLEITQLMASFVGVEATGSGAATFDNSDTTTFDGVPAPTGNFTVQIKGANTLLDKLIALNIIQKEQTMAIRMGAALLTEKVEGEDTLNSAVEFKDKRIFVNGKRMK